MAWSSPRRPRGLPRLRILLLLCGAVVDPAAARAHVGGAVASAKFCRPPPPAPLPDGDGGLRFQYEPEEADASYRIAWEDGDNDPTARLTLYYLARQAPTRVTAVEIEAEGRVVRTVGGGEARGIYVSCACAAEDGGGATCGGDASPVCFDGGPRECDNTVEWDTSEVPEGVYFIAAVNVDPPFHLYAMSAAPVRVSHGGRKPPAVVVMRPDGSEVTADASYRLGLLVAGQGPFTMDISYGRNTLLNVGDPPLPMVRGAPAVVGADGLVEYLWDTSAVEPGMYYVEVTVTDASGLSTTTRSRQALSIARRVPARDASAFIDGGVATAPAAPSCACRSAGAGAPTQSATGALSSLALAVAARRLRRRGDFAARS